MDEEWADLPGYEGIYWISTHGRVMSRPRRGSPRGSKYLAITPATSGGYVRVSLTRNGDRVVRNVHRLVLLAFVGPKPPGLVTRHRNGDRSDNHLWNLRYGTYAENQHDTVAHGHHHWANKTHCPHGHEYTPENTARSGGHRFCRACNRAAVAAWRERKNMALA